MKTALAATSREAVSIKPVRLGPRDYAALTFVASVRMIRLDDLALVLGYGRELQPRTVRAVVARWERCGLVERHRVTAGPSSITLTPHGRYKLRLDGDTPVGLPSWSQIPHTLTNAAIAVRYKTGFVEASSWSHPSLFDTSHTPDGVVETPELIGAIEVELNRKSVPRWQAILQDLNEHWDFVHYWIGPGIGDPLQTVLKDTLSTQQQGKFRFFELGELAR